MHPEGQPTRSPWALIVIGIVVILFGAFWYIQRPQQTPTPPVLTAQPTEPSLVDLQAAAINTEIPIFSDDF